jgi:hypothetical protein
MSYIYNGEIGRDEWSLQRAVVKIRHIPVATVTCSLMSGDPSRQDPRVGSEFQLAMTPGEALVLARSLKRAAKLALKDTVLTEAEQQALMAEAA